MKTARLAAILPLICLNLCLPLEAQHRAANPGSFDFYVLSLSWSPEFCYDRPNNAECAGHHGFVVHGLWPEFRNGGGPEFCGRQSGPSNPAGLLDIMPDLQLIDHEWAAHGSCSGLKADDYFALVRKLFTSLHIPRDFMNTPRQFNIAPVQVKHSFEQLNPGFSDAGIAIACRGPYLSEVEFCFTRDGHPMPCTGVHDCRIPTLRVPKIR